MIVVIGSPLYRPGSADRPSGAAGLAVGIAAAASVAAAGGTVQLVGRVGEDPAGDATLLALSALGIGHVATLRDAGRLTPLEPAQPETDPDLAEAADTLADALVDGGDGTAETPDDRTSLRASDPATLDPDDVNMALRYLDGYRVIVVAEPMAAAGLQVVADAAAFGGAQLVVIVAQSGAAGGPAPAPEGAIVIEAPLSDPEGLFAGAIGAFVVALDRGTDPAAALDGALAAGGWERSMD